MEGGCMTQQRLLNIDLPITVKTYDIDFMGIVSNITYVRWMEDLRLQFLETHYPLQKLMSELIVPVITQTHIEYKRPIRMPDQVTGSIWMEKFDSSGWLANMEFTVNGKHAVAAKQGGVFINLGTMKPANPPEGLQKKYDEALQRSL
jgi:acyl-CoA thioester hydrolase